MTMKFRRSGSLLGAGALLIAAVGCSAGATSNEQPEELGKATQAIDPYCLSICDETYWDYSLSCENPGLPGSGGNAWCYTQADEILENCQAACNEPDWPELPPPPDTPPPTSTCDAGIAVPSEPPGGCNYNWVNYCQSVCNACSAPFYVDTCKQACSYEYCPANCYEANWARCVRGCGTARDPASCTSGCYQRSCG
jgi:hypothetical protein